LRCFGCELVLLEKGGGGGLGGRGRAPYPMGWNADGEVVCCSLLRRNHLIRLPKREYKREGMKKPNPAVRRGKTKQERRKNRSLAEF